MSRSRRLGSLIAAVLLGSTPFLMATDHADGPRATMDPAADITDLYAWMSPDATRVYLVMNVFPNATPSSKFSDLVQYVFHLGSKGTVAEAASSEFLTDVICTFDMAQQIQCWVGSSAYVTGDASQTTGLATIDGKLKVFAGLRNDPSFFNVDGFQATATAVTSAASGLTRDAAGCPAIDTTTSATLLRQLQTAPGGGTAVDHYVGQNVLSLVVSFDKTLVTQGGSLLTVWGATRR